MIIGIRLKYKDTDEDLIPSYAKVIESELLTTDPEKTVRSVVGKNFKVDDIDTFEKLFNIILNNEDFKYSSHSSEILQNCAKAIKENTKLVFPIELERFL